MSNVQEEPLVNVLKQEGEPQFVSCEKRLKARIES